MDVRAFLAARVEPSPRTLLVAAGDGLAILAFVVMGEIQHGSPPLEKPIQTLDTFAPFLVGWLVAALFGGLYTADALKNPRRILSWTVPAWVFALLIGHGLRATPLFHGGTSLTFFFVTLGAGGLLVVGWRLVVGHLTG